MDHKPMIDRELVKFWVCDFLNIVMSAAAMIAVVGVTVVVCEYMR